MKMKDRSHASKKQEVYVADAREKFIRAFAYNLILQSYKPEHTPLEISKMAPQMPQNVQIQIAPPAVQPKTILSPPRIQQSPPLKLFSRVSQPQIFRQQPIPNLQLPAPIPRGGGGINLGKITSVLLDPAVFGVECQGPGKNLLVNRSGAIQAASLSLTKDEINMLMEEFSDKTRIPLVDGVFKAAFQDLILTAVVSDFVGTRFIIQKRLPFQRY